MAKRKPKMKPADIEVQKTFCATCPWRETSPVAFLRHQLTISALTESNRICHSTGTSSVLYPKGTGKPDKICRGARNEQLAMFYAQGFIDAPTDEAWYDKVEELRKEGVKI